MKHLVIYAHPQSESLNHSILNTAVNALEKKGHEVIVRDLYAMNFQPVLQISDLTAIKNGETPADLQQEQEYITNADCIILIYPIWWTGLPAILKGYIDRVFSYGFAYSYGGDGIVPHLTDKKGMIVNTYGTPEEIYDQIGMTEALRLTSDIGIFEFTGIEPIEHLLFGGISNDETAMKERLYQVEETINHLF